MAEALNIDQLLQRLHAYGNADFLKTHEGTASYSDLLEAVHGWQLRLQDTDLSPGCVGLVADYSLAGVAALLALWSQRACVALIPQHARSDRTYSTAGHVSNVLVVESGDKYTLEKVQYQASNPLLEELSQRQNPGLVLFSSGSSGQPKAVLHDFNRFAAKFSKPGKKLATYAFLVFDHVAGQDTLLYTLSAGGCLIAGASRRPETVAALIEKFAVQVLPTSPTFLNLMLASGTTERFDFSSIEIITYGSEPMDPSTLERLAGEFPNARIIQKYGTSEFGAIRSKSRSNNSLFIEVKEDETGIKIQDGLLWVKASGAMMGYLNAPSTLDSDGWICTGDMVEQDGRWFRILGRESDLINVGGEKVVPCEVEAVIIELDFVTDCTVKGEKNTLTGMIVVADVVVAGTHAPTTSADKRKLIKSIRAHCLSQLPNYKVPVKINFTEQSGATERQKKIRREKEIGN